MLTTIINVVNLCYRPFRGEIRKYMSKYKKKVLNLYFKIYLQAVGKARVCTDMQYNNNNSGIIIPTRLATLTKSCAAQ